MSHGWNTCNVGGCNCHYHEAEEVDGGCPKCHLKNIKVVELFPKKSTPIGEVTVEVDPLTYWGLRNQVTSDEFSLYNPYEKQQIVDTVLQMNLELYTLVVKLKERLGE